MLVEYEDCQKSAHHTFFYNIRTTSVFGVWFIRELLYAFAKRVHVRILENIYGHDDLIVSGQRVIRLAKERQSTYNKCDIARRVSTISQPARCAIRAMWLVPSMYLQT